MNYISTEALYPANMFNTASNCRIHKHKLPNTSADVGFPVCITGSVSETDGWHMRAARDDRPEGLYCFGQGNRQKGVFRISHPLAAVVSGGSAQATAHLDCAWNRSASASRRQRHLFRLFRVRTQPSVVLGSHQNIFPVKLLELSEVL